MTGAPDWWANLTHGGLLIAPSRVAEHFPEPVSALPWYVEDKLRAAHDRLEAGRKGALAEVLDVTLERAIGLGRQGHFETGLWAKGSQLGTELAHRDAAGNSVKPRRLWKGPNGVSLPVFVDDVARIGVHRGRRSHARVVEWLRAKGERLALLTNGRQWRLVHAGLDSDAWAESDGARWFEEGGEGPALLALRTLLAPDALVPEAEGQPSRLVRAIDATRRGQSELSASLGENVRVAVERLITTHGESLANLISAEPPPGAAEVKPQDVYVAACRVVMRFVVLLFAEAREGLLPLDRPTYRDAYSLSGLREALERAAGSAARARLRERRGGWPRILALFRLVHRGSHHPDLPIPRYGGGLFEPGDDGAADPVSRAIHVFESAALEGDDVSGMRDSDVFEVLRLLTRSRIKVRAGNRRTEVVAPVDFSDLSTEYIGILYEGLLDFELRRVDGDAPVVFLNLGDQPALALDRLEAMEDGAIRSLVEKLGKSSGAEPAAEADDEPGDGEESEGGDVDLDDELEAVAGPGDEGTDEKDANPDDVRGAAAQRVTAWALRAADAGRLVPASRSRSTEALQARQEKVAAAAKKLVVRTVLPGEWYLVRFGGTRKGSGTYYTKPQLAIPTVRRTLRPLCFDEANAGEDGSGSESRGSPRTPEEILELKVCDPACGSGSFLVAALRFLTDALYESLHHHGRIAAARGSSVVRLSDGKSQHRLEDELMPCPPDDEEFEPRLRARLRRHVVERCIHGVDLDPLAVELCRLALWVETLDRSLPFTFLDHRIKCGNALVGCWFDRFRDYPALAWERKGGDEGHGNGVHFDRGARDNAIRDRKAVVKESLLDWVRNQSGLPFDDAPDEAPEVRQHELAKLLEELHAIPVHDQRARGVLYAERLLPVLAEVRRSFDRWCAIWFWPADDVESSPLPTDMARACDGIDAVVERVAAQQRFFHWELEYPDVFAGPTAGFDAVIGNPPWEIQKPNSKEFFSNLDPLYRTYGKQEALRHQAAMFERDGSVERDWIEYSAGFKALSNWVKHAGAPFGDPESSATTFSFGRGRRGGTADVHRAWRERRAGRAGFADPAHPFRHQGSADINTYKLFLEQSHALLASPLEGGRGGRLGMIIPSGLYTDQGTGGLRELFLDACSWEWLFAFENRRKVFDIDSRFKFAPIVVEKGGRTEVVRTAFMRHDVGDWARGEAHAYEMSRKLISELSPQSGVILELAGEKQLRAAKAMSQHGALLGSLANGPPAQRIRYIHHEFFATADSRRFRLLSERLLSEAEVEDDGVVVDRDGRRLVPVIEGRHVSHFDCASKGWESGRGRGAVWSSSGWERKAIRPQFLLPVEELRLQREYWPGWKVVLMDVTSATNRRTVVPAAVRGFPTIDTVRGLVVGEGRMESTLSVVGILGSLAFDWLARRRVGGLHITWFQLAELPVPRQLGERGGLYWTLVLRLACCYQWMADAWIDASEQWPAVRRRSWQCQWAVTAHERRRMLAIMDAVSFALFGMDAEMVREVLRDCDLPRSLLRDRSLRARLDPKGLWRIDRGEEAELRHTVLAQVAFVALQAEVARYGGDLSSGIESFLNQNDGEGWMLPTSCASPTTTWATMIAPVPLSPSRARSGPVTSTGSSRPTPPAPGASARFTPGTSP